MVYLKTEFKNIVYKPWEKHIEQYRYIVPGIVLILLSYVKSYTCLHVKLLYFSDIVFTLKHFSTQNQ